MIWCAVSLAAFLENQCKIMTLEGCKISRDLWTFTRRCVFFYFARNTLSLWLSVTSCAWKSNYCTSLTQCSCFDPSAASWSGFKYSHITISSFDELVRGCNPGYTAANNNYLCAQVPRHLGRTATTLWQVLRNCVRLPHDQTTKNDRNLFRSRVSK